MARLSQIPLSRAIVALITEGTLSRFSFGAITFALPLYAVHLGLTLVHWYQTAKSTAGPVGAALAGFVLAASSNFSLVFGLSFLFSILPIFAVARFVFDPRMQRVSSSIERVKPMRKPRSWGLGVFAFTGFALLVETTAMMTQNLFPLIATTYAGLNDAQTGLIYLISTVAVVLAGPQFGWVSDKVSRRLVLLFRSFANGFSSVLYALVPTFPGFAVGRVLDGMGKAAYLPAWGAMMTHASDSDRQSRATMMGLMSMGEDAGDIIAPILATFLWSIWGLVVMLAVRVAISIAAEVYTIVLSRTVYHEKRVQEKSSQVGEPEIPAASTASSRGSRGTRSQLP